MDETGNLDAKHGGDPGRAALADAAANDVEDGWAGDEQEGGAGDDEEVEPGGFEHSISSQVNVLTQRREGAMNARDFKLVIRRLLCSELAAR